MLFLISGQGERKGIFSSIHNKNPDICHYCLDHIPIPTPDSVAIYTPAYWLSLDHSSSKCRVTCSNHVVAQMKIGTAKKRINARKTTQECSLWIPKAFLLHLGHLLHSPISKDLFLLFIVFLFLYNFDLYLAIIISVCSLSTFTYHIMTFQLQFSQCQNFTFVFLN